MAKADHGPPWYPILLSVLCFLGAASAIAVDRPYTAGFSLLAGVAVLVGARLQRGRSGEPAQPSRATGFLVAAGFTVVAVGAIVFLLNADGNVTAYLVGGVVLAIALYAVVAMTVRLWSGWGAGDGGKAP